MDLEKNLNKVAKWSFVISILIILYYLISPFVLGYVIQNNVLGLQNTFTCNSHNGSCCQMGYNRTVEEHYILPHSYSNVKIETITSCDTPQAFSAELAMFLLILSIACFLIAKILRYTNKKLGMENENNSKKGSSNR